jgi:hypothetical protein
MWEQAVRFTFQDPSVRYALVGSMLLGISCGLLGSFIVVRKMALVGMRSPMPCSWCGRRIPLEHDERPGGFSWARPFPGCLAPWW